MKYYLAKYDDNWADEMDIVGIRLFNEEEYVEFQKTLDKFKKYRAEGKFRHQEHYVGTNEFVYIDEIALPNFTEISETTYNELKPIFRWTFGSFPYFEDFICEVEEDEADE